jgi:hypothetical protein
LITTHPTPHATLEAAIGWSVDLLPDADRSMLLRLWPFEGGFPLEAVLSQAAGLETLSSFVSRSMVVADATTVPARCQQRRPRGLHPPAGRAGDPGTAGRAVPARHPDAHPRAAQHRRGDRPSDLTASPEAACGQPACSCGSGPAAACLRAAGCLNAAWPRPRTHPPATSPAPAWPAPASSTWRETAATPGRRKRNIRHDLNELGLGETSFPDCRNTAFRNAPMLAGSFVTLLDRA